MKCAFKVCLSFLLSFLVISCENDVEKVNSLNQDDLSTAPAETSKNVEFYYSDSAKVVSMLSAPRLDRYTGKKPYFEMIYGMKVVFYNNYPNEESKLTANYGIGKETGEGIETLEARNNVVVINKKGEQLNTEQLTWNGFNKKIYTDKFVKITTKDEVIWGDGLEANEDFSEYEIKKVKGQININDSI